MRLVLKMATISLRTSIEDNIQNFACLFGSRICTFGTLLLPRPLGRLFAYDLPQLKITLKLFYEHLTLIHLMNE